MLNCIPWGLVLLIPMPKQIKRSPKLLMKMARGMPGDWQSTALIPSPIAPWGSGLPASLHWMSTTSGCVLPKLNEHADGEHPGNVGGYALGGGVCGGDYGCRFHSPQKHARVGGAHRGRVRVHAPEPHAGAHGHGAR